jgi:hypothetical protein
MKACVGWPLFPAACALALGFVITLAPRTRTSCCGGGSKVEIARLSVMTLAYEAFPRWSAEQSYARCPANLDALLPWMTTSEAIDPWGRDYRFFCHARSAGPVHIVVWSAGPDRHHGNADDIRSDR